MSFEYRIAGIPCQIEVTQFSVDSDHWGGYVEIAYNVLDRRGYKADWLARKITPKMDDEIQSDIIDYMRDDGY